MSSPYDDDDVPMQPFITEASRLHEIEIRVAELHRSLIDLKRIVNLLARAIAEEGTR